MWNYYDLPLRNFLYPRLVESHTSLWEVIIPTRTDSYAIYITHFSAREYPDGSTHEAQCWQCIFQARHSRAFHRFACDDACPAVSRARTTRTVYTLVTEFLLASSHPFSLFLWMNLARRFAFLHNVQSVWLTVWNNRFSRSRLAAQASRTNERKNRCHVTAYFFFPPLPHPPSPGLHPSASIRRFSFLVEKKGKKGKQGR